MNIDWSKAPEGFPLRLQGIPLSQRVYSGWYRDDGEVFKGSRGGQWRKSREGQFFTVHRKPEDYCEHSHGNAQGCPECGEEFSSAWTGEGLPPVGTVCDLKFDHWTDWERHEILCHGKTFMFVRELNSGLDREGSMSMDGIMFRPIRTPEQIAADEHRAKYMPQLLQLWDADTRREAFLEAVYKMILEAQVP